MKVTKRQLRKMVQETKGIINEYAFEEVGGNDPVFHDHDVDEALNRYVERYVDHMEDELGESRATLGLLENMKWFLVDALERGIADALRDSGVEY